MNINFDEALVLARHMVLATGCSPDEAAGNSLIPIEHQEEIKEKLHEEETIQLIPTTTVSSDTSSISWLNNEDRSGWYYWPRLRNYLLESKKWPLDRIRYLDDDTDEVLKNLSPPKNKQFEKLGLVIGYVQSGKTANYTSLIAKAADVGYRLFIVLAGMDNGLRRQTQIRLMRELVGYPDDKRDAVKLPPPGKQWHVFTTEDTDGDFRSGSTNTGVLQGSEPVLMVIKKNGYVLRRVLQWLDEADTETIRQLPVLVIDDEADQASVDTRGSRVVEEQLELPADYEEPSVINRLIRQLLSKFKRRSFVAYTATPFANILIPVDQYTLEEGSDLYPRDFIIDLPKPRGYLGAEELFGRTAFTGEEDKEGMDVFRPVPDADVETLNEGLIAPPSLQEAMFSFILAGAARYARGDGDKPVAMLVHISHLISEHTTINNIVMNELNEIKNQWRYNRNGGIENRMRSAWDKDFCPTTQSITPSQSIIFDKVKRHIGEFIEAIDIKVVNSQKGDILDYEVEPSMKPIIIGGNKLSRGLTIEGLLVSYFTRQAQISVYDTVMQMGRWFGYREGYADLTRLYLTPSLAQIFALLAQVEHRLREDLAIYARQRITPKDFGMRILHHPQMLVTSRLKQRYAQEIRISYSGSLFQTFRFPLDEPDMLTDSTDNNLQATKKFLSGLGTPKKQRKYITWKGITPDAVLGFLADIRNKEHEYELEGVRRYIEERRNKGELVRWTVAISPLQKENPELGTVDWGINTNINQISRTRLLRKINSLGVITDPNDEENIILSDADIQKVNHLVASGDVTQRSHAVRTVRNSDEGLLILYPISKLSAPKGGNSGRALLFEHDDPLAENLIGIAIPFPVSQSSSSEVYVTGTPRWANEDE